MLKLRDYQLDVKRQVYDHIRNGQNKILLCASTGSGKTECAASIVSDILSRDRRVAFMVHRDNLVRQTIARFEKYGIKSSAVAGGMDCDDSNPCQVVSMQTLERRKSAMALVDDVAIYDEAHLTAWRKSGRSMIQNNHHKITIGLTATPWRLSKREEMGDLFNALVLAPVPSQLIEMGFLVRPRCFGLSGADLNGVKTVAGDFALDDLSVLCNDDGVVNKAVSEWQRLANGLTTIVFCVDVAHARHMAEAFQNAGVAANYVSGDMCPVKIREPLYADLKSGKLTVLCSCNALSEGFDVPNIECVILARPTKSKAIFVQQLGRGLRLSEGKTECLVLDQAGNIERHGFIEDLTPSDFALIQSKQGEKGDPPVKECPECGHLHRTFDMTCPECGYEYPLKEKVKNESNLVELRTVECNLPLSGQLYREWKKEAFKKGIAPGYAMAKFKELHPNQWPSAQWSLGAVFNGERNEKSMLAYLEYLEAIAIKKDKDYNWINKEFKAEFGCYPPQQILEVM